MIALYSRVSTQEQAEHGYSIGEQQDRLIKYCEAMGWSNHKLYTDAGYSGANTDRPDLKQLIRDVKAGRIEKVIVYKLDRLSRSQKDTLMLIEDIFLSHNCDFISMSENFDTSTPFGRAMIGILSVFAQLEREQIKERMMLGKKARAKQGKFHGGAQAPVGYDYIGGKLIINEFEAMQVRETYRLYLEGHSYQEIADFMNEHNWKHKYGGWTKQRVSLILSNNIYMGIIKFSGEEFLGDHEPLIDKETFEVVQEMRSRNRSKQVSHSNSMPLMGHIWCARCGFRYTHKVCYAKYHYYICIRMMGNEYTDKYGRCDNKRYKVDELHRIIYDELRKLTLDDVIAERDKTPDNREILQKEIDKIDHQRSRLMDLYALGSFTPEEIQTKLTPLNQKKISLELQIEQEQRRDIKQIETVVKSIGDVIDTGDTLAIRQIVNALIDRIEIDGDDITIRWNFN